MLNIQFAVSRPYSKLSSRRLVETPRNTSDRFVINPIKYKYIVGLKWSFLPTSNSAACGSIYMFSINENRRCSQWNSTLWRKFFDKCKCPLLLLSKFAFLLNIQSARFKYKPQCRQKMIGLILRFKLLPS